MGEKIKVLVVNSDSVGISLYRVKECHTKIQELYSDEFDIQILQNSEINWNDIDNLKTYDIIFAHTQFVDFKYMEQIVSILRQNNVITILDTDDYWDLDITHPLHNIVKTEGLAQKKIDSIKLVDYVTTPSPTYAEYIKKHNKNVVVFENGVDDGLKQYKYIETEKPEKVRIIWSGGSSHLTDLSLLTDSFEKLRCDNQVRDKYQLHLVGFDLRGTTSRIDINNELINDLAKVGIQFNKGMLMILEKANFNLEAIPNIPKAIALKYKDNVVKKTTRDITPLESVWSNYERIFTSDYKLIKDEKYKEFLLKFNLDEEYPNQSEQPYIRHKTSGIYTFANNYRNGDIALAPLRVNGKISENNTFEDTVLNRYQFSKSNLKIIEAGIHKIPVIASDIPTYNYDPDFIDGKNIIFVKPSRQEKDWYQKMKNLILNRELIKEMGEAAYDVVMKKYHQNVLAYRRKEFYKKIVNERKTIN